MEIHENFDIEQYSRCNADIENRIGYEVYFMSRGGNMTSLWLPVPAEGRRFFSDSTDPNFESVYFEAVDGRWYAFAGLGCYIKSGLNVGVGYSEIELVDKCIFSIVGASTLGEIYCEAVNYNSGKYKNYIINRLCSEFSIGRVRTNDIVYPNPYVSSNHARMEFRDGAWYIHDCNSTNGVFVNGKLVASKRLRVGDRIFIMGLHIIMGVGFLSINDGNDRVFLQGNRFIHASSSDAFDLDKPFKVKSNDLFNRLPRKTTAMDTSPIVVDGPPMSLSKDGIPLLLRMGSPMVMSTASLLSGNITSMISSVLFPVITQKYTEKQKNDYEEKRIAVYCNYLNKVSAEIQDRLIQERRALDTNYPELTTVLDFANHTERLWERRNTDEDFLTVRVGNGRIPLASHIDYPEKRYEMDDDVLLDRMYDLVKNPYYIDKAPVLVSLIQDYVCGVIGNKEQQIRFVRRFLMQLALLHSYDEVKVIMLADEEDVDKIEFVRYIPHIWNDNKDFRFLATNTNEAYQISEYLKTELEDDTVNQRQLKVILKERPYYVVFALNKKIFDSMEVLKDVMKSDVNCGVSVVAVFNDIPKECSKIFSLDTQSNSVIFLKEPAREKEVFYLDGYEEKLAANTMLKVSNTCLKLVSQAYSLPKMITFLDMFGVGRIEHLNPLQRWQENNPVKTLAAPVGVATDGSTFTLDLHEKFQGPHGLVAGMTGSGKSEFIITYILSMAINYHPDEVAFILIDYKGGGLAGAFDDERKGIRLPHLVGTITNLDGAAITRSLMSIQSELMRRQRIFNEAKSATDEGTMDIYTYQSLYRRGVVSEPLPHLFIISDEFAELKKQEPEFMDKLISTARIGRSLGVHLILATQKPSGVVDDQIWSNTKFRVCLKVQGKSDSYEMLKRNEAAEIKETGRFYLQVGYNEFFALGQSAWCGAAYEPKDEVVIKKDDELQFLDSVGQPYMKIRPETKKSASGKKQIVEIVKYLSDLAERENIHPRQMWTEPLAKSISLSEIREQYADKEQAHIYSLVGLIDDPSNQTQFPYYIDVQSNKNILLVGEAASGKTVFLQTLLFDLVNRYSPDKLNVYIIDFSSRNLAAFSRVPHCGGVVTEENEDKTVGILTLLERLIAERKKLFADADVSSYDAYIETNSLPLILLVIDNISHIDELKSGREYYEMLERIMSTGVTYGIRVISSISQVNSCQTKVRRNSGIKISLRARDSFVYSDILDVRCRIQPIDTQGRGVCVIDDGCYEFQTALAFGDMTEQERSKAIKNRLTHLADVYADFDSAEQFEKEDNLEITYAEFCEDIDKNRIPIGVNLTDGKKISMPLQQFKNMSLYFGNYHCAAPVFDNVLYAVSREGGEAIIVKRNANSMYDKNTSEITGVRLMRCDDNSVNEIIAYLTEEIIKRKAIRNEYCDKNNFPDPLDEVVTKAWRKEIRSQSKPIFVIFESIVDLPTSIEIDTMGTLSAYMSLCADYNIYFIGAYYFDDETRIETLLSRDEEGIDEDAVYDKKQSRQIMSNLQQTFNTEKFALFFGGRFDKQRITVLPLEYGKIEEACSVDNIDKLVLLYRGRCAMLSMPVQKPEFNGDIDEMDII